MTLTSNVSPDEEKMFSRLGYSMPVPRETMVEILLSLSKGSPSVLMRLNDDLTAELDDLTAKLEEEVKYFSPCRQGLHIRKDDIPPLLHILVERKFVKRLARRVKKSVMDNRKNKTMLVKLCNYIAAVIAQTYVEAGEEAALADDEALMLIKDLLFAFDETIILRNASKPKILKSLRTGIKFAL